MNIEMKVTRFRSEDVIATSVTLYGFGDGIVGNGGVKVNGVDYQTYLDNGGVDIRGYMMPKQGEVKHERSIYQLINKDASTDNDSRIIAFNGTWYIVGNTLSRTKQ